MSGSAFTSFIRLEEYKNDTDETQQKLAILDDVKREGRLGKVPQLGAHC